MQKIPNCERDEPSWGTIALGLFLLILWVIGMVVIGIPLIDVIARFWGWTKP